MAEARKSPIRLLFKPIKPKISKKSLADENLILKDRLKFFETAINNLTLVNIQQRDRINNLEHENFYLKQKKYCISK